MAIVQTQYKRFVLYIFLFLSADQKVYTPPASNAVILPFNCRCYLLISAALIRDRVGLNKGTLTLTV